MQHAAAVHFKPKRKTNLHPPRVKGHGNCLRGFRVTDVKMIADVIPKPAGTYCLQQQECPRLARYIATTRHKPAGQWALSSVIPKRKLGWGLWPTLSGW